MDKDKLIKLVEEFKAGDASKFEDIYIHTNNRVYNYIFLLSDSLNEEDCFELLQETYIQANNKISTLKDCRAFNSWICTIARNKALRYLEKKKKEILLPEESQSLFENQYELDYNLLPEEIVESKEKQRMLLEILNLLPEEQRQVIILRYYNGLSVKEIALQLKISEGTVKSRLNYGRKKIEGEVIKLEKKGTKLYGTSIPIILLFLRISLNGGKISEGQQQGILNNIIGSKNNNSLAPKGDKAHSNLINKSRSIPKEACAKFIVGGTILCVLGYGGFVYRDVNKNAKNSSVAIEKKNSFEDTGIAESNLEEVSFDILSYEIAVNNLYEKIKFHNFMGKDASKLWEMDSFINQIELVSDGEGNFYYDSTYPNWANDIILVLIHELNAVTSKREKILLDELNKGEEELIRELDEKIIYFINNQDGFEKLNEKLAFVISHGSSEAAIKSAAEFQDNFKEYKKLLDKLKNIK